MTPTTPYSADLGTLDPIAAMADTLARFRTLTSRWSPEDFSKTYAPGKWTARQLLIHLAHSELALGTRARLALTTPSYVAQAFDQDGWMARESHTDEREALEAFLAVAAMNRSLFASLSMAERAIPFTHPEYGAISIDWLIHQMAGHQIHHLRQMETIR